MKAVGRTTSTLPASPSKDRVNAVAVAIDVRKSHGKFDGSFREDHGSISDASNGLFC